MAVRIINEKWINPEDESLNALRYVQGFCLADDEKPTENICTGSSLMAVDSGETYYFTEGEPGSWAVVSDGGGVVVK